MRTKRLLRAGLMGGLVLAGWLAEARTIVLDARQLERAAGLEASAPRHGWAMTREGTHSWANVIHAGLLDLTRGRCFLFAFSLADIPKGHRITHAELVLPISTWWGTEPRFYLWRVLAEWGHGVCWDYRLVGDKRLEWTRPGAAGMGSDRAARPTAIVRLTEAGSVVINVTEDLDLWQRGAAAQQGWLLSVEDPDVTIRFPSPLYNEASSWKLRISFEPEAMP